MENENRFTCTECGRNSAWSHDFCDEIIRRREENQRFNSDRRAILLARHPWLTNFLDRYSQWQERHPNSNS